MEPWWNPSGTLVQPWWNPSGTLVEPWCNPGGTLVEPWWNPGRTLPQGHGPPRSLSGLRPQSFQLLKTKDLVAVSLSRDLLGNQAASINSLRSPARRAESLCTKKHQHPPTSTNIQHPPTSNIQQRPPTSTSNHQQPPATSTYSFCYSFFAHNTSSEVPAFFAAWMTSKWARNRRHVFPFAL